MLFVKLYKQKGKTKGNISNMKGKIQIEVKDLITNHSESVSDSILFAASIFPSCYRIFSNKSPLSFKSPSPINAHLF